MSDEPTNFLYPFIDSEERDVQGLLDDLSASAEAKFNLSASLREEALVENADAIRRAGEAMAKCFRSGGRLFAFGNGGSSTDAESAVALFRSPPSGRPLAAVSLVEDRAVLTALANDVGFDLVFSRQVIAHGHTGDIALGYSTSGDSVNVLKAFEEASRRGMVTVGLSGYEGGAMAASDVVSFCMVVHSDSVHRIQETQDALTLALWEAVQEAMG
jgi:D-sedoheptulose 7-phosphate isomerase